MRSEKNLDSKWIGLVTLSLRNAKGGCKSVVKFLGPNSVAKATWHKKPARNHQNETMIVSYGAPNRTERRWIRDYLAAGQRFPVNLLFYVPYPKKRRK